MICTCDGAIIKTDSYNVGEVGIPPGVIDWQTCTKKGASPILRSHMTTVKYHFIAFDREALRVHLSRHLTAFGQSDDLFQALGKAKDFMELGPEERGTSRAVQLLNAMATTRSNNPNTCIKRPKVMSCIAQSVLPLPLLPKLIPTWPKLTHTRPKLTHTQPKLTRTRPNLTRTRPKNGQS